MYILTEKGFHTTPLYGKTNYKGDVSMTKEKLKETMKQYCIVESELDDVISFVADLLHIQARELEKTEPHAIRSIDLLHSASREVDGLMDYISDMGDIEETRTICGETDCEGCIIKYANDIDLCKNQNGKG